MADVGNTLKVASTTYQISGDDITPVTASVGAIVSGTGDLTASNNSLIGGASSCKMTESRTNYSAAIGSINCDVVTSSSSGSGKGCVIVGCNGSNNSNPSGTGNGIYSSRSSRYNDTSTYCAIFGCNSSSIIGEGVYNAVCSSTSSSVIGHRTNNSIIAGSIGCNMRTSGSNGDGEYCIIIGSNGCNIGSSNNAGIRCGIYSSKNSSNTGRNKTNAIIGAENALISGNSTDKCIVMGLNSRASRPGNFVFSDSAGGTILATPANNRFAVRSSGGARFFTNTTNTIGVSLASGGSSWAVVSDRNIKENIRNLGVTGCCAIAEKFKSIPICTYNYIGCPEEQLCYGPIAQDWHMQFGATGVTGPVLDEYGEQVLDPETSSPLHEVKPAKDPLKIETMDMIGVLMATTQHLQDRVQYLRNEIELFKQNQ